MGIYSLTRTHTWLTSHYYFKTTVCCRSLHCVSTQQHREAHNRLPSVAAQRGRGAKRAVHLHATIQQYQMSDVPIPKFLQTEIIIAAMH